MDDLSLLQNVRSKFTSGNEVPVPEARITRAEWEAIDAELLRLARDNAVLRHLPERICELRDAESERDAALFANHDCVDHFNAMKADYDALRKRIDGAPHVCTSLYPAHGSGYVEIITQPKGKPNEKVFALVPLDDAEAKG